MNQYTEVVRTMRAVPDAAPRRAAARLFFARRHVDLARVCSALCS